MTRYISRQWRRHLRPTQPLLFSILICLSAVNMAVSAQTTSTTILGAVADSAGAVVAGAKVTATNTRTGVKREVTTSSNGDFSFPLLDVGVYDVTIEAHGFKPEVRRNVILEINEKVRVDFSLQVGATTEMVEVIAGAATLRTDDATLGQTVEQRRVEELPLNNRNLGALAILQPGVQYGPRSGSDGQGFGQRQGAHGVPIPGIGLTFVANGQRETNQTGTLDGVVATEARVNTIPFSPSVEAVQEFRTLAGSYSAEYGFNAGAQVHIVTKSGGNDWHGSAFEFLRNDIFDAENFFQNYFNAPGQARSKKDSLRQNNFGGVLTGPFWIPKIYDGHNKTFFMVNYEARLRRQGNIAQTANHPPMAFRNGDFSSLLSLPTPIRILDPVTGTEFPGNIIPANRITNVAKEFMKFWPEPQRINANPLTGVNFTGFERRTTDDSQVFVRVDHNFSEKDKIFGRYAFNDVTYTRDSGRQPELHLFRRRAQPERRRRRGFTSSRRTSSTNSATAGTARWTIRSTREPTPTSTSRRSGLTGFRVLNDNNRKFTPRETGVPTITVNGFFNTIRTGRRQRIRFQQPASGQRQHHVDAGRAQPEVRLRFSTRLALPRRGQRPARRIEFQRRSRGHGLRGVSARLPVLHRHAGRFAADRRATEPLRDLRPDGLESHAQADAQPGTAMGIQPAGD